MAGRQGLIKKRITAMRKGKPVQTTVWVRPSEQRMAIGKSLAQRLFPGAPKSKKSEPSSGAKKEAPKKSRTERRQAVMTKYRRQAPGKGVETQPTEQEVKDILDVGRYALVSAGKNPNLEADMSPEAQAERHGQLRQRLVKEGFQFTQVLGKYGDEEDSFLVMVHDADRDHVIKIGEDYNQDSIIYGENGTHEMHFTTGEHKGKFEVSKAWNDQSDADDYYTEVKQPDGSSYKFNIDLQFDESKYKTYKPGSRKEYLYGVDDEEEEEILARFRETQKRRRA